MFGFMTEQQEKIAEIVIQKHKNNHGVYDWKDFNSNNSIDTDWSYSQRTIIRDVLKEDGFIVKLDVEINTRLTESGWNFISFDDKRKKDKKEEITKNRESWGKRNYILITIFSIFITAVMPYLLKWLQSKLLGK
jgi:hypothetical protein